MIYNSIQLKHVFMFRRYFILQLYSLHSLGFSKEEENWQKANFYLQYENILSYIIGFLLIPLIANLLIYFSDKKKLLVGNVPPELHNDYLQMYFESERMVGESVTVTVTSVDSDSNTCGTIVEFKEEFRKWMFYSCRYTSPATPFRQRFSPTQKKRYDFPEHYSIQNSLSVTTTPYDDDQHTSTFVFLTISFTLS